MTHFATTQHPCNHIIWSIMVSCILY